MRGKIICVLAIVLVLSLSLVSIADGKVAENQLSDRIGVWPVLGGDPQHTGQSEIETSDNFGGLRWSMREVYVIPSVAIDSDGVIYAPNTVFGITGYLKAINPNGSLRWTFAATDKIQSCPAISNDGNIFFGSDDGTFYSLSPNGTERWRFNSDGDVTSPIIDDQGRIYFCSMDGKLHCLDEDGNELWNYSAESIGWMNPALNQEGQAILGSNTGTLYCIHPNGTLRWSSEIGKNIDGTISVDDNGNIYCIDNEPDRIISVDSSGNIRWSQPIDRDCHGASIGSDGTVYCGDGLHLLALNENGSVKWRFETAGTVFGPPAISFDGTIYFGSSDGSLYALDRSGNEQWRFEGGENAWIWASPAIGPDGTIYIGNHNSELFAINGIPDVSPGLVAGAVFALIMGILIAIWVAYPKKGN